MASFASDIFKYKAYDPQELLGYGFKQEGTSFVYTVPFMSTFSARIKIIGSTVDTVLTDISTGDPYTLHLVQGTAGDFVDSVREELTALLKDIAEKCFHNDVFHCEATKELLSYSLQKYATKAEFPWDDLPDYAVLRRSDTKKWYAVIMTVKLSLLSKIDCAWLPNNSTAPATTEIVNFHAQSEDIPTILKMQSCYKAYHMNKAHWFTVVLGECSDFKQLHSFIDTSYLLAAKKQHKKQVIVQAKTEKLGE